jgi:HEPN domain-containing protein
MTNLRQDSGQDYPAASRKHCQDARILLDNQRSDGAAYLAGYASECIIKTIIQVEEKNREIIKEHDLDKLSVVARKLMSLPGSRTVRYFKDHLLTDKIPYADPPSGWKETLRYYPEKFVPPQTANQWVENAERLYIDVIGGLLKDGEVNL